MRSSCNLQEYTTKAPTRSRVRPSRHHMYVTNMILLSRPPEPISQPQMTCTPKTRIINTCKLPGSALPQPLTRSSHPQGENKSWIPATPRFKTTEGMGLRLCGRERPPVNVLLFRSWSDAAYGQAKPPVTLHRTLMTLRP